MGLRVRDYDLGGNGLEAYYTEHPRPAVLAVQPGLPRALREARRVEGEGYYRKRSPKGGRKFCFEVRDVADLDPNAVLAIRSVIEELRPEWVDEVREACRIFNHPRLIADWCELSIAAVVAIIGILEARGEVPPT